MSTGRHASKLKAFVQSELLGSSERNKEAFAFNVPFISKMKQGKCSMDVNADYINLNLI